MKKLELDRRPVMELSMLTTRQLESFVKSKLKELGFDMNKPVTHFDDPKTGHIIYTQKDDEE